MDQLARFTDFFWSSFLLLSPMLLLGLLLAGLIHVFVSGRAVQRWLREDNLKSVSASAAIGVPIPLCSCSVVPVVAEMRRKGASRSSCMSFLITAPETGLDSILVTNAFFGPLAAMGRPVMSVITAIVAGIACVGLDRDDGKAGVQRTKADHRQCGHHDHGRPGCGDRGCDDDCGHRLLRPGTGDCYISPGELRTSFVTWLRRSGESIRSSRALVRVSPGSGRALPQAESDDGTLPAQATEAPGAPSLGAVARHVLRYGFVETADDILFALLVGLALGGLLYLAIPPDLMAQDHARWISYPVMVIVGLPLYICASASTPIAAALVAKGVSPGAAVMFLMTGPATNTGTIAIILKQFGARFASIYVGSVVVVTVVLGIAIDMTLIAAGLSLAVNLEASETPALMVIQWGGALGLGALMIWRFRAGAFASGYRDLLSNFRGWGDRARRGGPA